MPLGCRADEGISRVERVWHSPADNHASEVKIVNKGKGLDVMSIQPLNIQPVTSGLERFLTDVSIHLR